ncbi:two-component system OmpR family response regulator [Streptosporangium album]|uniref:Two-component system OmpR family response regulator n=1 Tax=Streptosporangium album TaxID=47479 RepID=A0A7W7S0W7_9ACTN|nr:response regulator transcription factor [Streptosporangium album]MBB4940901.1 two-component system OmpR family response regulator [Streptosporangium album]
MRVLLVEDEPRIVDIVRRGLAVHHVAVDVRADGIQGLRAAVENDHYDVIILDIMLPGLSGYNVVRGMRERRIWTPVLMLTAKDGEYDEADAFDLGADDYLTKPFSFVVLVARLRALARRGGHERPVIMTAGDLTVDPALRRVARGDVEVGLTPREYEVLEFLMRRKGEAVAKSDILAGVWDADYEGGDNVVEVYVRYLRRKLDEPFGRCAIRTVRTVGYALDPAGG